MRKEEPERRSKMSKDRSGRPTSTNAGHTQRGNTGYPKHHYVINIDMTFTLLTSTPYSQLYNAVHGLAL